MVLEDWIVWLEPWVEAYGLYVIAGGILIENAGVPVPGETFIVMGAIMAARGVFTLKDTYLASVIGAILGGMFGYAVGRMGGRPFINRLFRIFRLPRSYLARSQEQFRRWGPWAIFFGRFLALLRILAGPLAGMLHMPFWQFFLLNASGAIVWAGLIVGIAYELGENLPLLEKTLKYLGRGSFVLVGLLIALLVAYHIWYRRREHKLALQKGQTGELILPEQFELNNKPEAH